MKHLLLILLPLLLILGCKINKGDDPKPTPPLKSAIAVNWTLADSSLWGLAKDTTRLDSVIPTPVFHPCDQAWLSFWDVDKLWRGERAYSDYHNRAVWHCDNFLNLSSGTFTVDSTGHSCDTRALYRPSSLGNNIQFKFYPFVQYPLPNGGGDSTYVRLFYGATNTYIGQGFAKRIHTDSLEFSIYLGNNNFTNPTRYVWYK